MRQGPIVEGILLGGFRLQDPCCTACRQSQFQGGSNWRIGPGQLACPQEKAVCIRSAFGRSSQDNDDGRTAAKGGQPISYIWGRLE